MTEFSTVWEGAMINIVGTFLGLVILFFGGIIWDSLYTHFDDARMLDDVPGHSWDNFGPLVNQQGNMFYTIALLEIIVSWAAGIFTVYQKQRYDRYIRQY
jgi:hypothetical protein